jgi:hypothetical protein
MTKVIICNAFSLNMLPDWALDPTGPGATIHVERIDAPDKFVNTCPYEVISAVGHEDTARIFSCILQHPVEFNRVSVTLEEDDILLVGQYKGPRLPEGATELPEGAEVVWSSVEWAWSQP